MINVYHVAHQTYFYLEAIRSLSSLEKFPPRMFVFKRASESNSSAREQQVYVETARTVAFFFGFLLIGRLAPLLLNRARSS